ncbi:unnamed protein product [Cuscuta europaea]|uniref:PPM-type phosphatase domain-containing protein n=1 Tax=Cuscuta europaea TaxID=41803 RepID=A0A9P0ZLF7_CUSEU|nr:unnamed protein product [Cuscuta europaea]
MGSCWSSESSRSPLRTGSPIGIQKRKNFKKRRSASRNSSFDHRREEHLHRVSGRRFLNGSNEVAALFTQQGKKGTNQDAMVVWEGRDLVIGNIGDSRAVLGTRNNNNSLTAVQLTVDLKPNLPVEAERIKKCKGRVFALRDEPGVHRVWLPNADSPGLAMARAFGDFCLKDFGLISVPEVSYRRLTEKDEFVVLATDGIWDVLSNEEVVKTVGSSTRSSAAKVLVETAVRSWRTKYPNSKVDDCAVVCLFLDSDDASPIAIKHNEITDEKKAFNAAASIPKEVQLSEEDEGEEDFGEEDREVNEDDEEEVDAIEWSALEGVSRVNTLVTLPRFEVPAGKEDKKKKQ